MSHYDFLLGPEDVEEEETMPDIHPGLTKTAETPRGALRNELQALELVRDEIAEALMLVDRDTAQAGAHLTTAATDLDSITARLYTLSERMPG